MTGYTTKEIEDNKNLKEFYNEIIKGNICYEQFADWVTYREKESLEEGYDKGYDNGYDEGYQEGSNAYSWSED
jgi:flagellar biosynthesis/type III secretory pathway protein FliH